MTGARTAINTNASVIPAPSQSIVRVIPRASETGAKALLTPESRLLVGWIDHQAEHYGKLVSNYRSVGIVPPISRKAGSQ